MRSRVGLPAFLWLFACGTLWAQTPVPFTNIQIRGSAIGDDGMVFSYRAYQNPGVPYRILCPVPCTADQNAIFGLYAGFGQARQQVVNLMGVDSLSVNQPFDLHVTDDHWCGTAFQNYGGDSGQYQPYSQTTGTFGCFWFTTPGKYFEPFQYPQTSTIPYQTLTAHEFTHTEFFTRHWLSYEDFAKAVSFYVSGSSGAPPITDPCDPQLDSFGAGKLIWGLCQQSGFQWADLAPAMQSINTTYLNGKGETSSGSTSPYQFRKALEAVLGKDATDAFLASKQAEPGPIGGDGTFRPAGGRVGRSRAGLRSCWHPTRSPRTRTSTSRCPTSFPLRRCLRGSTTSPTCIESASRMVPTSRFRLRSNSNSSTTRGSSILRPMKTRSGCITSTARRGSSCREAGRMRTP